MARIYLAFLLVLLGVDVRAQSSLDIELMATLNPPVFYPPGTQGTLTITVRNNGPAASPGTSVATNHFLVNGPDENILVFPTAATAPCTFVVDVLTPAPGQSEAVTAIIGFGPLAAGASRTCTVGVLSQARASGTHELQLRAGGIAPGITESNPSNNAVTFRLLLSSVVPLPVPAVGQSTTLLLVLLMMAIATRKLAHEAAVARTARTRPRCSRGQ